MTLRRGLLLFLLVLALSACTGYDPEYSQLTATPDYGVIGMYSEPYNGPSSPYDGHEDLDHYWR